MAKKKITELELSLLHLQQNVEIPEISLNIHPIVQKTVEMVSNLFMVCDFLNKVLNLILYAIKQADQEGKKANVDMIDQALLSDSMFLNKLQGDVNGWIKE